MTARFLLRSAAMVACLCCSSPAVPARAGSEPAQSLDDQLLESLRADPLDEFDRELFAPQDQKRQGPDSRGGQPDSTGQDADDLKRQLLRELGAAAAPEEEHPLLAVARSMRQVEGLIAQTESGPKTQDLQNRIVASLAELIKQARSCSKQSSPSQSSSKVAARQPVQQPQRKPSPGRGKPSQKRVTDPNTAPGKAEAQRPSLEEMRQLIKGVWGELPETEREQMLEWAGEEFLPKYELLIEEYFKRLAEERRAAGD